MLDSAVIEVRQHLCCANVFLKFKQSLTNVELLKIVVDETKVKLQSPECSTDILVHKYFSILAGTFNNLIVNAENASFRISIKDIQLSEIEESAKRECLQIKVDEHDEASVICINCDSVLAIPQTYSKIREFPSGAIDVSEFFCHHGPDFKDVLVPSATDLFYGFQYIVINRTLIEKNTREKDNHIYCKRCLKHLGETMFNDRAAKIWGDTICFGMKGKVSEIFFADTKSNVYKLLLKAIEETSLPSPEPLLRNMHFTKVVLNASFSNRQQQFLLVHILEKHLPVLRYVDDIQNEMRLGETQQSTCFEPKQHRAFKILYRLITKEEDDNCKGTTSWPPILEYWQQDINILKMNISPCLFSGLNKELSKNVEILPELYRVNDGDFLLSYIFY